MRRRCSSCARLVAFRSLRRRIRKRSTMLSAKSRNQANASCNQLALRALLAKRKSCSPLHLRSMALFTTRHDCVVVGQALSRNLQKSVQQPGLAGGNACPTKLQKPNRR